MADHENNNNQEESASNSSSDHNGNNSIPVRANSHLIKDSADPEIRIRNLPQYWQALYKRLSARRQDKLEYNAANLFAKEADRQILGISYQGSLTNYVNNKAVYALVIASFVLAIGLYIANIFVGKYHQEITDELIDRYLHSNAPYELAHSDNKSYYQPQTTETTPSQQAQEQQNIVENNLALSDYDLRIYREIFAAQQQSNWNRANILLEQLQDDLLLGHILADRYLHRDYISHISELSAWLNEFRDHPQAQRIYNLAQKKIANQPSKSAQSKLKSSLPTINFSPYLSGFGNSNGRTFSISNMYYRHLDWRGRENALALWKKIISMVDDGKVTLAYNLLKQKNSVSKLKRVEYDILQWIIADGYFWHGKTRLAFNTASKSANRSGGSIPEVHWTAGLSAWKIGKYRAAAIHFDKLANARWPSIWDKSAAAFWAYRAHNKTGNSKAANISLKKAANYPRTFYGILANHKLGNALSLAKLTKYSDRLHILPANLKEQHIKPLINNDLLDEPSVRRAYNLKLIDKKQLAEQELRKLFPTATANMARDLLLIASWWDMPTVQMPMAHMINSRQKQLFDDGLYPIPTMIPEGGFSLRPSLIWSFARQESGFYQNAVSRSGAMGIMQIMPRTASYISSKINISYSAQNDPKRLFDPHFNLMLGQSYLQYLQDKRYIGNNIIYLASAYNAGPTNLFNWQKNKEHIKDPLLFIETIPSPETRNYVVQILANYWIYNARMNMPSPSIAQLANGSWPLYYNHSNSMNAFNSGEYNNPKPEYSAMSLVENIANNK